MIILRNRARCKLCGDEIESLDREDYKCCHCLALCIDGGRAFLKRAISLMARDIHDTDYMHEYVDELSEFAVDSGETPDYMPEYLDELSECEAGICNCPHTEFESKGY